MIDSRFSERHRQILSAAMELFAERGFAGASLRELARRVRISQPSLYHYFQSKEQLIEQIADTFADMALSRFTTPVPADTPCLRDFVRLVLGRMIALFDGAEHSLFMRFAYRLAMERRELGRVRERFLQRGLAIAEPFFSDFEARGELAPGDGELMMRMATNAMALHLLQTRVFGSDEPPGLDANQYADFVADTMVHGVRGRRERLQREGSEGAASARSEEE